MILRRFFPIALSMSVAFVACDGTDKTPSNPLLAEFNTPFEVPPFDKIEFEHFRPAYEEALRIHSEEIDKIVNNQDAPNFENTIVALDNSGQLLQRVALIFNSLNSAHTNDSIQGLARELAPKLSAHRDEITRSEEHTSELQSRENLVCRPLLEKK